MDRDPCPVSSTVASTVVESPKPQMLTNFDTEGTPKVERDSPEPNCAICLGKTENKSFTDSCLHQFCFNCLLEWSKVKPECPLCKQNFKSIIHNIRSNDDYDKYDLQIPVVREPITWPVDNNGQRFRYRTTLTVDRQRERLESSLSMRLSMRVSRPLFLGTDAIPSSRVTHRRNHRYSTSEFRTSVYRHNLWVIPLPDVTGRYRECSPEFYRMNQAQLHRLVPWLNRELNVLQVPYQRTVVLVQDILNMITQVPINSVQFQAFMSNQVMHAEHFVHEFHAFARSPYDMIGFDETAEYETRPAYATEVQSIETDSDSDIYVLSPVSGSGSNDQPRSSNQVQPLNLSSNSSSSHMSTRSPEPGPSRASHHDIARMLAANLQNSPSPTLLAEWANSVDVRNDNSNNSNTQIIDSDSDDCMIVGYVKPRHERTPEIYTLSSDAEGGRQEEVIETLRDSDDAEDNQSALYISCPSSPTTNQSSDSDFVPHRYKKKPASKRKRPHLSTSSSSSSSSSDDSAPPVRRKSSLPISSDSISPDISRKSKKSKSKGKHKRSKCYARMSTSDSSDDDRPEPPQTSRNRKPHRGVWRIVRKQETETDHDYSRDCYDPPYTEDEIANFSSERRPKLRSIVISKSGGPSGQREHSYSSVASSSRSSSHYHESKHHRHKVHRRVSKKRKERKRSESSSPVRPKGKRSNKKRSRRIVDSSS